MVSMFGYLVFTVLLLPAILAGPIGWEYVGCRRAGLDEVSYGSKLSTKDTTEEKCGAFCIEQMTSFPSIRFFGMLRGYACSCQSLDNTASNTVVNETACFYGCVGNKTQKCGGATNIMSLFKLQMPPYQPPLLDGAVFEGRDYSFKGCYDSSNKVQASYGSKDSTKDTTIGKCANFCAQKMKDRPAIRYFGLLRGYACQCQSLSDVSGMGQRNISACFYDCVGNKTQKCGGSFDTASFYKFHRTPYFRPVLSDKIKVNRFTMDTFIARSLPWTVRPAGNGNTTPRTPKRMYGKSCKDLFYLSWSGRLEVGVHVGRFSTFRVANDGSMTHLHTVTLDLCHQMGDIELADNCSYVGVLCRTNNTVEPEDWQPKAPIYSGETDPARDFMYFVEWRSWDITPNPDRVTLITKATGGWEYGHYEVVLTNDDVLIFELKGATVGALHEVVLRKAFHRSNMTDAGEKFLLESCGGGHALSHRCDYNKELNITAKVCNNDASTVSGFDNSIQWITKVRTGESTIREVWSYKCLTSDCPKYGDQGGVYDIISLGTQGWMACAAGPLGDASPSETIGLVNLPPKASMYNAGIHKWNWLKLADRRVGLPNFAYVGPMTEKKLLVGWCSVITHRQGLCAKYHVAEYSYDQKQLTAPISMDYTGWGEDNKWVYLPDTGCVAWFYTWIGDRIETEYTPNEPWQWSNQMVITTYCPKNDAEQLKIWLVIFSVMCNFLVYLS